MEYAWRRREVGIRGIHASVGRYLIFMDSVDWRELKNDELP